MRALLFRALLLGALGSAAACGNVAPADDAAPPGDDAGMIDAGMIDASVDVIDAAPGTPDAAVTPQAATGTEVITGGGTMQGATYQMDVTIGHPASQKKIGGGGRTLEGATPIKP